MNSLYDLLPKTKSGSYHPHDGLGKRIPAIRCDDVTAQRDVGYYQFIYHHGGPVTGIAFKCFCGCGEINELIFDTNKTRLHGGWNGRFSSDEIRIMGNRVSIIDGFWQVKF